MPRLYHMTYVPSQKRWTKMVKGVRFYVSTRQLGTDDTKAASWQAANVWWEMTLARVMPKHAPGSPERRKAMIDAYAGRAVDAGEAPQLWYEMVNHHATLPAMQQSLFFFSAFGKEKYETLLQAQDMGRSADKMTEAVFHDEPILADTMQAQCERWLKARMADVASGKITAGSYDNYARDIVPFVDFVGRYASVSMLDGARLEDYHLWLAEQGTNKFARLGCAKAFVAYLYRTCKDFVLPRNLSTLTFGKGEATKERWTLDEWQHEYGRSTGLRKLCLLLAANCAMQGADMANLSGTIDWERGCITRARTKTGARTCTWFLWDETLDLLRKHHDELPALWGKQMVGGKLRKRVAGCLRGLGHLRHTSATFLENSEFKAWTSWFMGHAETNMAEQHYGATLDETSKRICAYLHSCYFP